MVEVSTSILTIERGKEAETFFALEKSKTDYFHIDVMDGKFVEKDTYKNMLEYASFIKRISNLPMDVHLMVEDVKKAVEELGLEIEVEYITDMEKVMAFGVMSMPAIVVNEKVVSMGKVLKSVEVIKLLGKLGF